MLNTKFVTQQFRDGTMTDQNALANALLVEPEIANTLIYAYGSGSAKNGMGDSYNVLQYLTQGAGNLGKFGKTYKPTGHDEIMWPVQGKLVKALPISGPVNPGTDTGIGFSEFVVPLAQKLYSVGFVCRFENGSIARLQKPPYKAGNSWCHVFVIIGSNPSEYIPSVDLEIGKEVSWDFTAYEEGSDGGGNVEATPMWFKNQMTISRMAQGMTGSAKNEVVTLEVDRNGEKKNLWMYEKQYQYFRNWGRQHERLLWNGRYNRLTDGTFPVFGENGRPVKVGSGIEEQIKAANTIVTTELTEEMLWHMLVDIKNKGNGAENQKRVLITGDGGQWEFNRVLKEAAVRLNMVDHNFVHRLEGNKLAFGAEFTTYKGPFGGEFTVVNHPMFNDEEVWTKKVGPYGYTEQSYKMFFLDFSDYGNEPNIRMLTRGANGENRQLVQWFTAGATTPNWDRDAFKGNAGDFSKIMRSHGGDYFMCYTLSETLVAIQNTLTCGMIWVKPPQY